MLKKPLTDALVQGEYMSGDRNTIATALRVQPKLGVLILGAADDDARAKELFVFYDSIAKGRCEICLVPKGTQATALAAVKAAYQEVAEYTRDRKHGVKPVWLANYIAADVMIQPAPYGTAAIGSEFKQKRGPKTRELIRKLWRLPDDEDSGHLETKVGLWLKSKGFRLNRAYVFLFTKTGERTAEKAHHFTSILTWRILAERISCETSVIPVATGESIGLRTTPTLVKFWDDPTWKEIFSTSGVDKRSAQLGMWCFLAERYEGLSIIGMRSGMIEVPGLLGIRTLYLEEEHNEQASRMVQWEQKDENNGVPGWKRQVVSQPPGIAQQIYWRDDAMKNKPASKIYKNADENAKHVEGLVYGVKTPVEAAKVVFGRDMLAGKLVPAEKFMLATSEFDSILKWVKATPVPTDATGNVHGSVSGILERRDVAAQDHEAARNGRSWSEYFASEEYRSTLPSLNSKTMK